ncbi:MAG: type II secretion system F family protein [bacterium]|nr:type II secretion system F family protein [bacterium]
MAIFSYKARSATGEMVTGKIDAEDEGAVRHGLRRQNLLPVAVVKEKKAWLKILKGVQIGGKKVGLKHVVIFSRQLSTLVNAGVPILQSLNILIEQATHKGFIKQITGIRDDIERGKSIAEALSSYPDTFSILYISMVKAGEAGGALDVILERLAIYLEKLQELKRKIRGALIYPACISVVAMGLVFFMLIFIVPTFKKVFESFGAKLPGFTLFVIGISDFLMGSHFILPNVVWMLIILVILFFVHRRLAKTERYGYRYDALLLKLPIFGVLFKKAAIAKFSRTLGTLVRSGVPILEALSIVSKTAGNRVVEKAVMTARTSIREGERITDPLRVSGVFPPMVTQMIAVGEETGALDSMLSKIADFYDHEVDAAVAALASVFEPLMIIVLGVIVGIILIAMYLPIFTMASVVGG